MLDDLREAGTQAAARGLRIGNEALAWGRHVSDHRNAWSLARNVDNPALGLVFDSFHSLARRMPSASIGDIRPDKLFLVQVADAPMLVMDYLGWSRHFRCMPGQGDFPLDDWAEAIRQTGYQGHRSLDIFNDRFRAGSATLPQPLRRCRHASSLAVLNSSSSQARRPVRQSVVGQLLTAPIPNWSGSIRKAALQAGRTIGIWNCSGLRP